MFDDDFSIRPSFYDVTALRLRMRYLAVVNLVLSPFIAIFLAMYFVMNNAERFYRHPGVVGQREWSTHAWWKLREFNELSHFTEQRLAAAYKGANNYVSQFPSPVVSMVAKFVSYIVGALAAVALALPLLLDDKLLHANVMWDKDILWVTMVSATVLAVSRGMVGEENRVFRPNRYMAEVVRHTHYLPKNWRNLAHKAEVQAEFEDMFAFKAGLFLQEMLSIFAVPFILWYPMCESAPDIVQFVRQFTVHRKGVGHICSLSAFDFRRHGDARYGAPTNARRDARSKQGKMEKSFVSFHAHYPTWEPDAGGGRCSPRWRGSRARSTRTSARRAPACTTRLRVALLGLASLRGLETGTAAGAVPSLPRRAARACSWATTAAASAGWRGPPSRARATTTATPRGMSARRRRTRCCCSSFTSFTAGTETTRETTTAARRRGRLTLRGTPRRRVRRSRDAPIPPRRSR